MLSRIPTRLTPFSRLETGGGNKVKDTGVKISRRIKLRLGLRSWAYPSRDKLVKT